MKNQVHGRRALLGPLLVLLLAGACERSPRGEALSKETSSSPVAASPMDAGALSNAEAPAMTLTVYKSPSCGCCGLWMEHLNKAGIGTRAENVDSLATVKKRLGLAPEFQACHTAVWDEGGYFFEGHVPAALIQRFLKAPPKGATGLAVPGMPIGSPGMEQGDRKDPYDVLLLKEDGSTEVYARMVGGEEKT